MFLGMSKYESTSYLCTLFYIQCCQSVIRKLVYGFMCRLDSSVNLYLYRRMCVCVCVYPSKRIHVAVCGPIGTKFGTHMQIHLEKVVGKIKICPVSRRGNLGGFRG